MAQLNPYITFKGNCSEAMNFYKEALGAELKLQTVGESPMQGQDPRSKDNVMHSELRLNGDVILMASDMSDGDVDFGHSIELCLICDSKEQTSEFFAKLSEGGNVTDPLKEEFFGTFGKLIDKFGVRWMFQFSSMPANL